MDLMMTRWTWLTTAINKERLSHMVVSLGIEPTSISWFYLTNRTTICPLIILATWYIVFVLSASSSRICSLVTTIQHRFFPVSTVFLFFTLLSTWLFILGFALPQTIIFHSNSINKNATTLQYLFLPPNNLHPLLFSLLIKPSQTAMIISLQHIFLSLHLTLFLKHTYSTP